MQVRFLVSGMVLLLLLLAGSFFVRDKRGDTMTGPSKQAAADDARPLMDNDVPSETETATFALG